MELYTTVTDVSSDITIDFPLGAGYFSWLVLQFNKSSGNPSGTRYAICVPTVLASSGAWYALPDGGSIRVAMSGTSLRIISQTYTALYLIRAYGYR